MMRARWLVAWFNERFPLRNGLFFVLLYLTTVLVARMTATPTAVALTARDVLGVAALWSFFLLLRIFDEHKDFAADAIAHPERVLQRGRVTLRQLRVLGAVAVLFQLGVCVWLDRGVGAITAWWTASLAWSLLMAREFFASTWLRRHLLVYAVSHMAVMVLLVAWVAALGAPAAPREPLIWALAALVFFAGFVFEVARKIRSPDEELPMADSYTRALGIWRAALLLAALALITWLVAISLARRIAFSGALPSSIGTGLLALVAVIAAIRFARRPTHLHAKFAEAAAGLSIMAAHAMVVAAVASVRTIVWR